ncbi:MAG: thioredoxin [Oscillospiraceae bacterium]|nr:thioredoxin [Oscillospiraceae bacterium]
MSEITLTSLNFEAEVKASELPVLVDFWATWCGPCKMIAPVVAEIAEELDGKLKVGKVNVDDESELTKSFGITSIPTLIIFKDGELKETSVGYKTKEALLELVENYL